MNRPKKAITLLLMAAFALTGGTRNEQRFISSLDNFSEAKYFEK